MVIASRDQQIKAYEEEQDWERGRFCTHTSCNLDYKRHYYSNSKKCEECLKVQRSYVPCKDRKQDNSPLPF